MYRKFPFIILFFIITGLLLSVSSCNDEEEQRRLSRAEKERLRKEDSLALKVAILPTSDCDFIRLADSLHLFDTLGVDVHLRHYNSLSECRYALTHNMVEGAAIDSVLAGIIEEKDTTQLTLSVPTTLKWRLLTAKKSRISRHSQLVDKIIATDSHGASRTIAMNAVDSILKKNKSIFFIQCEDVGIRCKMLTTGNVDGAMLPEPYATKAIQKGSRELSLGNSKTYGVLAFRSSKLKDKRIKEQYDLFVKACNIAKDSLASRK